MAGLAGGEDPQVTSLMRRVMRIPHLTVLSLSLRNGSAHCCRSQEADNRTECPSQHPQASHTRVTFVTPPARILVSIPDPTDEMVWERDFQNSSPSQSRSRIAAGPETTTVQSSVVVMQILEQVEYFGVLLTSDLTTLKLFVLNLHSW